MIESSKLDSNFYQNFNSCVLTSYAIASKYFTNIEIVNFFKDYCQHFNIIIPPEIKERFCCDMRAYEFFYDIHFQNEWKNRNCAGLDIILELHNESPTDSFLKSRERFSVKKIQNFFDEKDDIIYNLNQNESLLIATSRVSANSVHISIYGYDQEGFYNIETRPNCQTRIIYKSDILDFGSFGDGLFIKQYTQQTQ
jgi:hypothetical protein